MNRRDFLRTAGGTAGAGAVAAGPAAGQAQNNTTDGTATPNGTATPDGAAPNGTATGTPGAGGGGGGESHTVEMEGVAFSPSELTIAPGDTVVWENVGSQGHSVTAYEDDIPEDAAYFASGGFDSEDAARSAYPDEGNVPPGESYEYTFEVEGDYEYFCIPHEQAGMVGTVTVQEGGAGDGGGGGGGGGEVDPEHMGVPFQAHFVGLAAVLMTLVTLVYTFFLLKYGESPHASGGND